MTPYIYLYSQVLIKETFSCSRGKLTQRLTTSEMQIIDQSGMCNLPHLPKLMGHHGKMARIEVREDCCNTVSSGLDCIIVAMNSQ